jgi:hypothetical protein
MPPHPMPPKQKGAHGFTLILPGYIPTRACCCRLYGSVWHSPRSARFPAPVGCLRGHILCLELSSVNNIFLDTIDGCCSLNLATDCLSVAMCGRLSSAFEVVTDDGSEQPTAGRGVWREGCGLLARQAGHPALHLCPLLKAACLSILRTTSPLVMRLLRSWRISRAHCGCIV